MSTESLRIEELHECADLKFDSSELNKVASLLTVLSSKDLISLLIAAKKGIKSDLKNPEKLGLTKKRYYTRLKQLKDQRLVQKVDGIYFQTTLGSLIYTNCILVLQNLLNDEKMMRMIDALKSTNKYSDQEISQFVDHVDVKSQV